MIVQELIEDQTQTWETIKHNCLREANKPGFYDYPLGADLKIKTTFFDEIETNRRIVRDMDRNLMTPAHKKAKTGKWLLQDLRYNLKW